MWQKIRNKIQQKKKFFVGLIFVLIGVCLDRFTKIWALDYINNLMAIKGNPNVVHNVFPGFNIVLVFNRGIAFGIFNNDFFAKFMPTVLLFATAIIVCGIIYYFWRDNDNTVPYSLLIAGGIGNITDRLTFGVVVDFLDFYVGKNHWPAFNLADTFICCGILMYVLVDYWNGIN
jgi:signal peptidase II